MATNEQLYNKYMGLADLAKKNSGNPQTYLSMAQKYAPSQQTGADINNQVLALNGIAQNTQNKNIPANNGMPAGNVNMPKTYTQTGNATWQNGAFTSKPTLNVGGQSFSYDNPMDYANKYTELKNQGYQMPGNIDDIINWYTTIGKEYNPQTPVADNVVQGDANKVNDFGGDTSSSNMIMQFVEALKQAFPQQQQKADYQSPYLDKMNQLYDAMAAYYKTPVNLNPEGNEAWQAASQAAQKATSQEFAKRNMLNSNTAKAAINESALSLLPQFQRLEMDRYNQQGKDYLTQLGALQGLEGINYGMYRDNVSDANTMYKNEVDRYKSLYDMAGGLYDKNYQEAQDQYERQYQEEKDAYDRSMDMIDMQNKDTAAQKKAFEDTYNFTPTETQSRYYNAFQSAPADVKAYINDNYGNIAAIRDIMYANGLGDVYEGARMSKILNEGLTEYASDYGLPYDWTAGIMESQYELSEKEQKAIKAQLDVLKAEADTYLSQVKARYADTMAEKDLEKAQQELEKGNYDNYVAKVKAANIDQKEKQDLINMGLTARNIESQIDNRAASQKLAKDKFANEQDKQTYEDIDKQISNMYTSYDDETYKTVISEQEKTQISDYLDDLTVAKVPVNVIKALKAKYGIKE